MSTTINDGGPAFPCSLGVGGYGNCKPIQGPNGETFWEELSYGLSMRDYFAGQALAGNLASDTQYQHGADRHAEWAYAQADAMIVERNKKAPK